MEQYRNYSRGCYQRNNFQCDDRRRNMQNNYMAAPSCTVVDGVLAMALVKMQEWCTLYNPEEALINGTAFPELNLIFCGVRG